MAKNLWLNGTLYSNVGQVNLPQANAQGTGPSTYGANYYDVSPTTATQSRVLSGYSFFEEDGSFYEGTIPTRTSANVTISDNDNGASVITTSGYYSQNVTTTLPNASVTGGNGNATISPAITINTNGLITATISTSISTTVGCDSNGWFTDSISYDYGTLSITGTNTSQLTSQTASTYYTSTADRTIASQRWLVGAQTIKSVTTTNLSASYILSGITVQVGDSGNASRIAQVSGTLTVYTYYSSTSAPTAGIGNSGDIFLQIDDTV